jgi:hypothetical protein
MTIEQIKAERDELRKRADWYEELRKATDGGSESMTHEDAIDHVHALAAENKVLRDTIKRVHSAKGRYHTQIAMCDLFDLVGLKNERPVAALTKEATNG